MVIGTIAHKYSVPGERHIRKRYIATNTRKKSILYMETTLISILRFFAFLFVDNKLCFKWENAIHKTSRVQCLRVNLRFSAEYILNIGCVPRLLG